MTSRRVAWFAASVLLASATIFGSAHASPSPFATIPGGPIGIACVGDGPLGEPDQLVVTSYCPGRVYTVSPTGVPTPVVIPGFPDNWCGIESYLAVSPG